MEVVMMSAFLYTTGKIGGMIVGVLGATEAVDGIVGQDFGRIGEGGAIALVAFTVAALFWWLGQKEKADGERTAKFLESLKENTQNFALMMDKVESGFAARNEAIVDAMKEIAADQKQQQRLCDQHGMLLAGMSKDLDLRAEKYRTARKTDA